MASGWASDDAVQEQIDSTINDAIAKAREQLNDGESEQFCLECGEQIPEARQKALKGVKYCLVCQEVHDQQRTINSGYNRRGSKDSQLR